MPAWRPQNGRNAIVELAHQILELQELAGHRPREPRSTSASFEGGTTTNVVPAHASAEIDVRVASRARSKPHRVGPDRTLLP